MKITVVLEAFVQTSYETYTHKYRTVDIEVPDDGNEWHVAGEMEALKDGKAGRCGSIRKKD